MRASGTRGGPHAEMVMMPQQAVGEDLEAPPDVDLGEAVQEDATIRLGVEDGPRGEPSVHHMVGGAGKFTPEGGDMAGE